MRRLSVQMLEEDPFQLTGKVGTLEKIQNLMRGRLGLDSSKDAVEAFWTMNTLGQGMPDGETQPLDWFKTTVRPLIEQSNYVRKIGLTGEFINDFWRIDRWFALYCFIPEVLIRIIWIRIHHRSLTWREAALWRWYDVFLVVPLFPWLRVIPVVIRLQESGLVDIEPIRAQASRGFVAAIAGELIEVIALQVLNQVQRSVQGGEMAKWLMESGQKQYIDLNNINEVQEISRQLAKVVVYQVLPQVQPDVRDLLQRNVELAIQDLPISQAIQGLPGLQDFSKQLSHHVSVQLSQWLTQLSQSTYNTLTADDPLVLELIDRLAEHGRQAFGKALLDQATQHELQSLISAFLEEVKVNYVQRLREEDFDDLLEEATQLSRRS